MASTPRNSPFLAPGTANPCKSLPATFRTKSWESHLGDHTKMSQNLAEVNGPLALDHSSHPITHSHTSWCGQFDVHKDPLCLQNGKRAKGRGEGKNWSMELTEPHTIHQKWHNKWNFWTAFCWLEEIYPRTVKFKCNSCDYLHRFTVLNRAMTGPYFHKTLVRLHCLKAGSAIHLQAHPYL